MWWRILPLCALTLIPSVRARIDGDRAAAIARIHVAAIGGPQRIAALSSFRVEGHVVAGAASLRFTLTAARPDRLRMEFRFPTGRLIQATDGVRPPWELDTRQPSAKAHPMNPTEADTFLYDARFDDPLIAADRSDEVVEFAGDATRNGHRLLRLMVTRDLARTFFLFVDPETYFIVGRIDPKPAAGGVELVTEYDDFRPVAGVLLAHRITLWRDGRLSQTGTFDSIQPNPPLPPDTFTAPAP